MELRIGDGQRHSCVQQCAQRFDPRERQQLHKKEFLVLFQAVVHRSPSAVVTCMCVGGFCGGGARGGRLAVAAYPTAVGPAQSACYNNTTSGQLKIDNLASGGPMHAKTAN